MQLRMIGLGHMGANMARRPSKDGHEAADDRSLSALRSQFAGHPEK